MAKKFLIDIIGFKRAKGYNLRNYDEIEMMDYSSESRVYSDNEEELVRFTYDNDKEMKDKRNDNLD